MIAVEPLFFGVLGTRECL